MHIKIHWSDENFNVKNTEKSAIVLVDVLRTSTFIPVALYAGAKEVFVAKEENKAIKLKRRYSSAILAGERSGIILKGFDLGNSPYQIRKISKQKTVILTSGNFCNVVEKLANKKVPVIAGGIVNARAVAKYLYENEYKNIHLVSTGTYHLKGKTYKKPLKTIEDYIGVLFIIYELSKFEKINISFPEDYKKIFKDRKSIKKSIFATMYAKYLIKIDKENTNKKDINICSDANEYPCIPILNKRQFKFVKK